MADKSAYEQRFEEIMLFEKWAFDEVLVKVRRALSQFESKHSRLMRELAELAQMRDDEEVLVGPRPKVFHRLETRCGHLPWYSTKRMLRGEARRQALRPCSFCWYGQ